jgi:hypothetical protein
MNPEDEEPHEPVAYPDSDTPHSRWQEVDMIPSNSEAGPRCRSGLHCIVQPMRRPVTDNEYALAQKQQFLGDLISCMQAVQQDSNTLVQCRSLGAIA